MSRDVRRQVALHSLEGKTVRRNSSTVFYFLCPRGEMRRKWKGLSHSGVVRKEGKVNDSTFIEKRGERQFMAFLSSSTHSFFVYGIVRNARRYSDPAFFCCPRFDRKGKIVDCPFFFPSFLPLMGHLLFLKESKMKR